MDILALLPAGEWAQIHILNQAPGMMTNRNWAILARARWLRGGGKAAFIKFIVQAGSQAGPATQMVTGSVRLKAVHDRLRRLQQLGDAIPLVPLLETRLTDRGLLVAMEEVEPLQHLIERGAAYDLSLRVLRDLDPEANDGPRWLHFDICPMNIGVLPSGRCVLIDVESLYLEESNLYGVTVPAWKSFRAPRHLVDDVQNRLAAGTLDRTTAMRKQRFEIALAAAECVMGPLTPGRGELDRARLESWLSGADPSDPAVVFWGQELRSAIDHGDVRPISDLCMELEAALHGSSELPRAPPLQPMVSPPAAETPPAFPESMSRSEAAVPSGWSNDWMLLKPAAHALRAGKLDRARTAEYRVALERLARDYPSQREVWDELLLVVISYEKDPVEARVFANEAVAHLPNDPDLIRMRNIIHLWVAERQNDSHDGR